MAPTRKSNKTKECKCSVCKTRFGGSDTVSVQTFNFHKRRDDAGMNIFRNRLIIKRSVETTVSYVPEVINNDEQNSVAIDNDYDMDYDFDEMDTSIEVDMETQEPIRILPLSESDAVFGYENEEFNSDLDSDGCEDDSSEDDMLDSEDNFPEFNSELSFIHRFIVQVLALFVSLYVVDEGAILLIAIMNKILELFRDPFRLPVSIPGLKSMAGFNTFTDGIKKYVSCSECHSIYENNESTPRFCIFDKFGNNSMCVENGVRWSELHRLQYFDVVRCTIIDPMHNLFLGTAKRMMEKWVADGLIDNKKLVAMQKIVENMTLPPDYTMLRSKISKGFPFMKADEWKSWCLVYSPVVLQGVLPKQKFENWMFFVNACRFLTKPNVSEDDVQSAHIALEKFGKGCERLYSKDLLSPNMHLHLHLRDTIKDFGPVYGYWLFSFERYNSVLKNINTNRRSGFEMTYMKTFIEDTRKGDFVRNFLKTSGPFNFSGIFDKLVTGYSPADSTTSTALYNWFSLPDFLDAAENPNLSIRGNEPLPPSALPLQKKAYEMMLRQEYDCLVGYYQAVYNDPTISSCKDVIQDTAFVNDWIEMLKSVNLLGQTFKGSRGTNGRGSYIQAMFIEGRNGAKYAYVGQIQYLFVHSFSPLVSTPHHRTPQSSQHTFAYVKWYKASKETSRKIAGVEIWDVAFSLPDFQSILPVHRILLPVAIVDHTTLRNISKKLIVPLPRKLYF
ncbi:hypothetical protein PHYBLDRAFT_175843 [Phycomyces blakesleeanus NRRL 1555(-)]|uniref:Uncharacterized protein n=1 Tax=Phycomyces blakesleeanus (strain ATCC 8743b / DSM 1359 / FGSC 10004 / NBRC 33097 / NRRL 1555) TaxID=763407 RepID=A0A162T274_PHYB8|nr:hypothetical protein PHYBLDRAFT_175843 [Phycomyces blakesleeanus NRRL 1555(-)]OAD65662.1 hypothetical protein PHYBLDRAFT_175843 [Phycomyces blakesleeanus NRRL 1555(-)]|eukprot:XP_018283702.1 hypothetical protein PHYBLDRAFT_175843 [Phycomyces blakesleeanus NRRL 1555(-)]